MIINADDFGKTREITDKILDCFDNGSLTHASVIVNTDAFDYAIEEWKKRKGLGLTLHLNLTDGYPLTSCDMLIDDTGKFNQTFWSLVHSKDATMNEQVRKEITAQIEKLLPHVKDLRIDGHYYCHLVPFIFNIITELDYEISYMRLVNEKFFLCLSKLNHLRRNFFAWRYLNSLYQKYKATLSLLDISYPDYFIGLLYGGSMTEQVARKALSIIPKGANVEILFHPRRDFEAGVIKRFFR